MLGGDPGRVPSELTLENWQSAPHLHWTFQHIADFLPTAVDFTWYWTGRRPAVDAGSAVGRPAVRPDECKRTTVGDVMAATATDGWIVTQHGKVLAEHYYGGMSRRHPASADVGEQVPDRHGGGRARQ